MHFERMGNNNSYENQQRFLQAKKDQGLKRVILWARPEDVDSLKTIARQPHSIAKLRKKVEGELTRKLKAELEPEIRNQLRRKTRRAFLMQERAGARKHPHTSNSPPPLIRFGVRPPAKVRDGIKASGWLYDPVACVWHLPTDPKQWDDVQKLLDELKQYDITALTLPPSP